MADDNIDTNIQAPDTQEVELQQLEPQPILSIRETIQVAELPAEMGERIPALLGYLEQSGAQPAGPIFVRYHTVGEVESDLEIGIPVVEPVAGNGQIVSGELPGGPAIATWHLGPHDDKFREAYARLGAWPKEHGREPDGPSWEVYYWIDPSQNSNSATQPDPSTWRTQLVQPIK